MHGYSLFIIPLFKVFLFFYYMRLQSNGFYFIITKLSTLFKV